MSQTNPERLEKYRGTAGQEIKTADISSETHELRSIVEGDSGTQERIYDSRLAGERFVNFYDDSAAALREALSNAETACIRRAKEEALDAGLSESEIPDEVSELLTLAKEKAGYESLIEVTYNRKPDATRLVIEDNGIGISVEEYEVVQRVGYSTSHDDGSVGGQFGIGWLSMFQLTGVNGMFKMSTKSRLTDEAYSTVEYVANFEMLDEVPTEYGTRFEFPGFGEAAKEIDIPSKVAEYADGMTISVLYRDFDASGQETNGSDDFLATRMEDDYSGDSMVVVYENEFFKAVMSPDSKESERGLTTYNISMPIRRNTDGFGTNNKYNAPWKWDFRAKQENGPIVACESDESLVGLVPKENTKYDRLTSEMQEKCVPMSQTPDDAIVMPEPASSRDSFMGGHNDFWKHVSDKLNDAWAEVARERFEDLDSWDSFKSMESGEKEALFRAYSQFGPSYTNNDPDNIQETLEEAFDVTIPVDVCEKLDKSRSTLKVVPRGHNQAHLLKPTKRNKKKIWEIIDEAPDGVYMGKSVSQKKAEIAWGLGNTHVIRVDPSDGQTTKERYAELEDLWGFDKLKDLPSSKLKQKLPDLSDDVADEWESRSATDHNTGNSASQRTSRDPTTKRIKVRVGTRTRGKFSNTKVSTLESLVSNDENFSAGRYNCSKLIVYDQTEITGSAPPTKHADRNAGIAVTAVPKYVYKYLKDLDNVYTDYQTLRQEMLQDTLDTFDVADRVYFASTSAYEAYKDDVDALTDALNEHCDADFDDDESVEMFREDDIFTERHADHSDFDAELVFVNPGSYKSRPFRQTTHNLDLVDIRLQKELPDMEVGTQAFRQVFGKKKYLAPDDDKLDRGIEMVKEMGGTFPDSLK